MFQPERLGGSSSLESKLVGWSLTHPFNLTGTLAISIPCGLTSNGRRVGRQIVGGFGVMRIALLVLDTAVGASSASLHYEKFQPADNWPHSFTSWQLPTPISDATPCA